MHFTHNNKRYRVQFTYSDGKFTGSRALRKVHNKRIATYCEIGVKDGDFWHGLAGSMAIRHSKDPFRKAIARRTSLGFATSQLADKELRKAIWDEYFDTHNDGWREGLSL